MRVWFKYSVFISLIVLLLCVLKPSVGSSDHGRRSFTYTSAHLRFAAVKAHEWMASGTRMRRLHSLDDLPSGYIPYEYRRYFDPESGRAYDWLYYGADIKWSYPSNRFIFMAAPTLLGSGQNDVHDLDNAFRVVVYLDTHTERLSETEFRERIQLQEQGIFEKGTDEK